MEPANNRTVVIGLELGDGQLVKAWAEAGLLPFFKELIDTGSWAWLETTAEQLHISAWPCIYTGVEPGDHGVYFTFQPAPGLQGYQRFHAGLYGRPTFWSVLDQAGRRCAVLDAPYTHPEEGFGGAFVHDWGTWAHYLKPGSSPPELLRRMEKSCGRYPLGMEANDLGFTPLEVADTTERLLKAISAKAGATCWLMQSESPEMLFVVFGETHVAGHYLWSDQLADPAQRLAPSAMLSVYQALDRAIAEIRAAAGRDATFMVISGDSVGPNHAGWHLLPELLERLGFLVKPQAEHEGGERPKGRKLDPVKALRDLLPKDFRKNLARKLPTSLRDKLAQRVDTADIDWSRTRAFWLPTDLEGYIRVNLRGREPNGIVAPGGEFEAILSELAEELGALRDANTGRPVVRNIIRTDQCFAGDRRDYLPDLVIQWDDTFPITAVTSPTAGTVSSQTPDSRPGTHRGPGFFVGQGPGIPLRHELQGRHILDLAPTLLARHGVPAPAHMRGRAWPELTVTG